MQTRAPSGGRLVTPVFLLVTFSTFAYFVAIGALIPTLPRYVAGPLGGGEAAVGLAVGSFSVTAVLLRPFVGRLGDRRGRRMLMILGAGLVGASAAAYVFAESYWVLIALRLLTGAGEAFFYVGAASVINDLAPDHRRGEALSFFSLALYAGLAFGPVLGETTLGRAGYDPVWLLAGLSAGIAVALALRVPDTRPESGGEPPRRRLVHPAGLLPGTILATSVWGLAGFNTFIPLYALEIGLDGSRTLFVAYSAIVMSLRLFGARIPDRLGTRRTARTALASSTAGLLVIGLWAAPAGLFFGAAVFAVGQALAFPTLMSLAVSGTPPSERAAVVGTFTAFFDLAFGAGALSLGAVARLFGYRGAFIAAAAVAFAGLVLMLGYARRAATRGEPERVEEVQEPRGS
ncbi:MAG TPA: MFS transporter [Actinomycetota bacterium]|jgi:MFS family permease|nr:MFS transporter [Actinomycetota bacterium]